MTTVVTDSDSSSEEENGDTPRKSIPGYYYDRKKKKYFKIQDGAFNTEHCLTKSHISRKRKMKKVKKHITSLQQNGSVGRAKVAYNSLPQVHSQVQLLGERSRIALSTWNVRSLKPRTIISVGRAVSYHSFPQNLSNLLTADDFLVRTFKVGDSVNILVDYLDLSMPNKEKITAVASVVQNFNTEGWTREPVIDFTGYDTCLAEVRPNIVALAKEYHLSPQSPIDIFSLDPADKSCTRTQATFDPGRHRGVVRDITGSSIDPNSDKIAVVMEDGSRCAFTPYFDLNHQNPASLSVRYLSCFNKPRLASHATNQDVYYASSAGGRIIMIDGRDRCPYTHVYQFSSIKDKRIHSLISINHDGTLATSHISGMKCLIDVKMQRVRSQNLELVSDTVCDFGTLKCDRNGQYLSSSGLKGGHVYIWDARTFKTLNIIPLGSGVDNCRCEMSTKYGDLSLLTMDDSTFTLYS